MTLDDITHPISKGRAVIARMETDDRGTRSPSVTVITVVRNARAQLERTLRSVAGQSHPHLEYIVVDGGSTDGTPDMIREYGQHVDYWVSEPDRGISDAFNKGIRASSNTYILLLNAGDTFLHDHALRNAAADLTWPIVAFEAVNAVDRGIGCAHYRPRSPRMLARLPHQATFVRRDIYTRYGGYSLDFSVRMDYEFFARVVSSLEPKLVHRPLVRFDETGISSSLKYKYQFEREGYLVEQRYFPGAPGRIGKRLLLPGFWLLSHLVTQERV